MTYADAWAVREATIAGMDADEKRAYSIGLSHAYADVFEAFCVAFAAGQNIHDLRERLSAQWDDVRATQIVRGTA